MIAMGQTIAGAASGETAGNLRRRRVHNLRQKDRRVISAYLSDAIRKLKGFDVTSSIKWYLLF